MDDDAIGIIAWIAIGLAGLIVLAAAGIGIAYASDVAVEATVTDKSCSGPFSTGADTVSVQTKLFSIDHTVEVSSEVCQAVSKGNFVEYYVRSERTVLYQAEGGKCLYDTAGDLDCAYG